MNNKICILTTVHYVFDVRIFHKQARTLANEGYDVTLIAQYRKDEIIDGIKIIELSRPKNRLHRMFWLTWKTLILSIRQNADVYHLHDPELIFIGVLLKFFGKKVIYDVHEDVPKQILNKEWIGNVSIRKIAAFIINIIEKLGAFLFNRIVVATPDIARKFPKNKTVILRNFPILQLIDNTIPANCKKNKPVIIYAGGLTKVRGIKEIIQSVEYMDDKAELWLLGKWESEKFKKDCENLEGWKYTKYLGFKNLEKVYSFMKFSNIGIINFLPVENNLKAGPNKIYEYMACSLPIVMSNFPYWQKIFKGYAIFTNPYDPKDIAEKISYLLDNPKEAKKMGERGKKLVEEKYSWETESKKLLEMYNNL